ncbi:MAG: thiol peroxidase [Bacteroidia bacterium]
MSNVTFKGKSVSLSGDMPDLGQDAPDFTFVNQKWEEVSLYDIDSDVKVILSIPSVDTGICAMETRKFNELMAAKDNVQTVVISKDLPTALSRFCASEGIENVQVGSDFRYNDFSEEFGLAMENGGLKGLLARAAFVLDKKNKIRYVELVPEIAQEPKYDAILAAVDKLLKK